MRPQQKSNRARGRGNRKGGGGGGGGNNINRVYESAGPEGKVRGTPQQIMDKYLSLARDAQTSGDRVMAENFLQHAEHYQRILIQALGSQAERRDNAGSDDGDDDEPVAGGYQSYQPSGYGQPQPHPQAQPQPTQPAETRAEEAEHRQQPAAEPSQPVQGRGDGGQGGEQRGGREAGQGRRRRGGHGQNGSDHAEAAASEDIGGLTTIDPSGPEESDLLVQTEEIAKSQPRKRRSRSRAPADGTDPRSADEDGGTAEPAHQPD